MLTLKLVPTARSEVDTVGMTMKQQEIKAMTSIVPMLMWTYASRMLCLRSLLLGLRLYLSHQQQPRPMRTPSPLRMGGSLGQWEAKKATVQASTSGKRNRGIHESHRATSHMPHDVCVREDLPVQMHQQFCSCCECIRKMLMTVDQGSFKGLGLRA